MLKAHTPTLAAQQSRQGLCNHVASRSFTACARSTKAVCRRSSSCSCTSCRLCGSMGLRSGCTTSSGGRGISRGDVLVARYREEESSDHGSATAVGQKPAVRGAVTGQSIDEDEGLLTHVPVIFELGKHCTFGHSFAVVGDAPELGAWDTGKAAQMEWSTGDVWRVSVNLPIDTAVSFKYVELGADGGLVSWGSDVAAGGNMTVTVSRSDELISGYMVSMEPPMQTDPDASTAAAEPAAGQTYLTARLDVTALLPMSAAFFKEKQLAVSAGLPAAIAEDLMTDRVLAEQGFMTEAELEAKWSVEEMSALRGQFAADILAEYMGPNTQAAPGGSSQPDADQLIAATESDVIIQAPDSSDQPSNAVAAAAAAAGSLDADDNIIAANTPEQPSDIPQFANDDIIGANTEDTSVTESDDLITATESDVIMSAPDDDVSNPPATPSATAAATKPMHGGSANISSLDALSTADSIQLNPGSSGSSKCQVPPKNTKIMSAGPSAHSIDLHSPLTDVNKAVVEYTADGVEPIDPIHVNEGLRVPSRSSSSSSATAQQQQQTSGPKVKITTDGSSFGVSMRGDDPLSLPSHPEVAAVRGAAAEAAFDSEAQRIGDQGLLVPREILESEADSGQPAGIPDVTNPQGAAHERSGVGSHEALLVGPDQAEALGVHQGEGLTNPDHATGSFEDNALAAAVAAAAAASVRYAGQAAAAEEIEGRQERSGDSIIGAAAAAAASVRYAGLAAAAGVQESAADADQAAAAVDERSALLHGPGADPTVAQIEREGEIIAAGASSAAEVAGVQEVSKVLRESSQEKRSSSKDNSGKWWKWILGKKSEH